MFIYRRILLVTPKSQEWIMDMDIEAHICGYLLFRCGEQYVASSPPHTTNHQVNKNKRKPTRYMVD
jgi:hypothetical protein